MIDIAGMGQVLQKLFKKTADKAARETKFVRRESKMTGSKFLLVWVIGRHRSEYHQTGDTEALDPSDG